MEQEMKIDIAGQKFGRLMAVEFVSGSRNVRSRWRCTCECGKESLATSTALRTGDTVSCGCKKAENIPLKQRLESNSVLNSESGCIEWVGPKDRGGYGRMSLSLGERTLKKTLSAHRTAYEEYVGPIPIGLEICHSCDNRACINPRHLWPGTHKQNMEDMMLKGRSALGKKRRTAAIATEATP